jgi:DnaB-like helicase C terminal domain
MADEDTSAAESGLPPAQDAPRLEDVDRPDPAADLQAGGFLDQVLERSKRIGGTTGKLRDELVAAVKKMRGLLGSPQFALGFEPTPGELPMWLTVHESTRFKTDTVLRLCMSHRWRHEDKRAWLYDAALKEYQMLVDEYDQVLGDLIPADFREKGHLIHADIRFNSGMNLTAAEDWAVYYRHLTKRRKEPMVGVSTGLPSLDSSLRGLHGLTFLGGGTGVGKSTLALFIAANALRKDPELAVLFYSLDMPKTVLYDRLVCQEAGIEYVELLTNTTPGFLEQFKETGDRLLADVLPRLRIAEQLVVPKDKTLVRVIQEDINQLLEAVPCVQVLIIVDYFQLLPVPPQASDALDADFHRVRSLQQIQEWTRTNEDPIGYPILAISEVRKGESGRTEISVSDLMGSARLGYSAEAVLLLDSKENAEGPVVPVQLRVAKGRDGAVRSQIDLLFEHTKSRFREAPEARGKKQGGKSKKETPGQKTEPTNIDPFAGMEGQG